MFSQQNRYKKNINHTKKFNDKKSLQKQAKWELQNYRETNSFPQFNSELTATGAAMLLLARFGAAHSVPQTSANTTASVSLYNTTQSGNQSILPGNSTHIDYINHEPLPPELLKANKITENKKKIKITPVENDIPIKIHANYQLYLETLSPEDRITEEEKIKNRKAKVEQTLAKLELHPEVMSNLKKTHLIIYLAHDLNKQNLLGFYHPPEHIIVLGKKTVNLQKTMLNEFHHAAIAAKNILSAEKDKTSIKSYKNHEGFTQDIGSVFFRKEKNNDNEKKAFHNAISEFKENLLKLKILLLKKKFNDRFAADEEVFYFKISTAIVKNYEPISFKVKNTHPHDIDGIMTAFKDDWDKIGDRYFKGKYANMPYTRKMAEFSSEMEMMPKDIMLVMAPLWCEYFSRFHEVKNYCKPKI